MVSLSDFYVLHSSPCFGKDSLNTTDTFKTNTMKLKTNEKKISGRGKMNKKKQDLRDI